MTDNLTKRSTDATTHPPRSYASPRLVVYGSLAEITRTIGTTSTMDGGAVSGMMMSAP